LPDQNGNCNSFGFRKDFQQKCLLSGTSIPHEIIFPQHFVFFLSAFSIKKEGAEIKGLVVEPQKINDFFYIVQSMKALYSNQCFNSVCQGQIQTRFLFNFLCFQNHDLNKIMSQELRYLRP